MMNAASNVQQTGNNAVPMRSDSSKGSFAKVGQVSFGENKGKLIKISEVVAE